MIKIYFDDELQKVYYSGLIDSGEQGEVTVTSIGNKVSIYNDKLEAYFVKDVDYTDFVDKAGNPFVSVGQCVSYLKGEATKPSSSGGSRDSAGNIINNVTEVFASTTSDADGQFEVDLTPFSFTELLGASAVVVGQSLTPATDINTMLTAMVLDADETMIRGVVASGNSLIVGALGTTVNTLVRGGSGNTVKITAKGRL